MDKVIIKNLVARGVIGINEWERVNKQDILINLTLFSDLRDAGESDNIKDCVNYRTVAKKVLQHAEKSARFTVEALAVDVAKLCFEDPKVEKVVVRVEKPGAVRFSDSVGVEIERNRS